ncbi:Mur ligase [Syncephalastrum racemosum]|uniref:Mur ligase n=1 Tax=Syncephalastrum racemosum TaxID=13706 RepID=A0A1X2HI83_SYNRA|nr:Mur ligase [Syncephalastrum racemosum]
MPLSIIIPKWILGWSVSIGCWKPWSILKDFHINIVHVAGTNGKDLYARTYQHVVTVNAIIRATSFEQLVATALCIFRDAYVRWAVIEVGLRGILDVTNVIACPDMTIITTLAMDQVAVLGNAVQSIADAKAGIMKCDCPAVLAPQGDPVAYLTVQTEAQCHGAHVVPTPASWIDPRTRACRVHVFGQDIELTIAMRGYYQRENAAVDVTALAWFVKRDRRGLDG